jgi:hypothetical protein
MVEDENFSDHSRTSDNASCRHRRWFFFAPKTCETYFIDFPNLKFYRWKSEKSGARSNSNSFLVVDILLCLKYNDKIKLNIAHLGQESHNSKIRHFLSYWYRKKRFQIHLCHNEVCKTRRWTAVVSSLHS